MAILNPTGMDTTTGQFKIAQTGDTLLFPSSTGFLTVLYAATTDSTLTNTITETSIIPTGIGTLTAPANFLVVGKVLRARIAGIYTTPGLGTPAITVKIKLGSTVIGSVTTSSLAVGITGARFYGDSYITVRSIGASGSVVIDSGVTYNTTGNVIVSDALNNGAAAVTIDTTGSLTMDVTGTWDTASTTRIIKVTTFTLEALN